MVNVKVPKEFIKNGARTCLFDVDVEGYPMMKYLIKHIQLHEIDENTKSNVFFNQQIKLIVLENEDYDAANSFSNWVGKTLTMRGYKNNGDIAYTKYWKVISIVWTTEYDWEASNEILTWNVNLTVEDMNGIEN